MDEENVIQVGNETQTWYTPLTRQRTWSIGSMLMQKRKAEESPGTDSKAVLKKSTPRTPAIRRRGIERNGQTFGRDKSHYIREHKRTCREQEDHRKHEKCLQ
jgi:hypothetical protein